ncbi:MAG: Gfo/Idh/MocA family oxidoreductase [Anaerolineae bacterium]|nr:Gfo/Idh/MocA family oxidoreductase [Anaerolineae bacterium]
MGDLRVGVVGLGVGKENARSLQKNARCDVTAICDILEWKMAAFAPELPEPVTCYADYREMCASDDIDAVMVATPNQVHVPVALEAVKNGKHVLVTKPLSDSEATARELVEAAEAAGVVNMMSLGMRFSDPVIYLQSLIDQGEFGDIYYARARSVRRAGIPDWNADFIRPGGGAFRDMGVHVLDVAWSLLGRPKPVSVSGVGGARFGPLGRHYWHFREAPEVYWSQFGVDDCAGGLVRFDNGTGLIVESFWASHMYQPTETQVELFGTEAGAQLRPLTIYKTVNGAPQDITVAPPGGHTGFDLVANHFVDCVLDGIRCEAPLRDGLIVQGMMEGMLRSAELGHEVR